MAEKKQNIFYTILGLLVLGFVGYLLTKLAFGIVYLFKNINWSVVNPTVLAAVITATFGVFAVAISNYLSKKREIEFQNRNKKSEAYTAFVKDLVETMAGNLSEEEKQPIYIKMAKEFGSNAILWGSDETVKAYRDFRDLGKIGEADDVKAVIYMEKILYAIRKDLGHKNRGLNNGSLLSLFVTDSLSELKKMYENAKK